MAKKELSKARATKKAAGVFDVEVRASFRCAFPRRRVGKVFCSVDELDGVEEPMDFKATSKGLESYLQYEMSLMLENLCDAGAAVNKLEGTIQASPGGKPVTLPVNYRVKVR